MDVLIYNTVQVLENNLEELEERKTSSQRFNKTFLYL